MQQRSVMAHTHTKTQPNHAAGFTAVFNMVWPHVRAALEREVLSGPKLRHVTVSGHSLGAAVATLVSYAAQRFLDAHNAGVTVSAMLVAAPNGAEDGGGGSCFVQPGTWSRFAVCVLQRTRWLFRAVPCQGPCSRNPLAHDRSRQPGVCAVARGPRQHAPHHVCE